MLIIYAHYSRSGHCGEILRSVTAELDARKKPYELMDLYEEKMDPAFQGYRAYDEHGWALNKAIREIQEQFIREKEFIIIYPIWWEKAPSILSKFLKHVLSAKIAFLWDSKRRRPIGLFLDKRALVLVTAGEAAWRRKWLRRGRGVKSIAKELLRDFGVRTDVLLIGNCQTITEKKKEEIQKRVTHAIKKFLG